MQSKTFFLRQAIFVLVLLSAPSVASAGEPRFLSILPSDGTLTQAPEVTLAGEVSGASRLWIDGAELFMVDGRFEAGPYALGEGERVFLLAAEDAEGHKTQTLYRVVRDSRPPLVTVAQPASRVVSSSPVRLRGTVADAHRGTVTVNGREAAVEGAAFSAEVALREGRQTLEIVAVDTVGNASRTVLDLTLDTTPPRVQVLVGEEGLADGASFAHAVAPVVTTEAGTRLELRLNGAPFRSGDTVAAEGSYALAATATDAAGNVTRRVLRFSVDRTPPRPAAEASAKLEVKSDTTPPAITISSPAAGAVVGATPIAVTGTATDEALATVTVDGVAATLSGSQFTATGVALVEGANVLTVTATDTVANSSQAQRTVTLDTTAPSITLTAGGAALAQGSVHSGQVTPEITVNDATAVTVESTLDGLPYVSGTTILAGGQHALAVTATDAAGNAASLLRTFQVEETPPVFASLLPADGTVTSAAEVTLAGRVTGAAQLTVDGAAVALVGSGDFVAGPYALAEGERTFTLAATSPGGRTTQIAHHVTRDATPPAVSLTSPAADAVVSTVSVTASGTASDPHLAGVWVNGRAATVTGATFSAANVGLAEGRQTLSARAEDAAGNAAEATRQVSVDTRAPVVQVTDPAPGTVVPEATLTISGTARDPHLDRVEVAGVAATLTGENFSIDVALAEGANTVLVEAFDTVGHRGTATVEVTRESAAPSIRIEVPAEGLVTAAAAVDVSGTVGDGATVSVNGIAATVTGGTFSVAGIELFEGDNRLLARATGAEGAEGVHTRMVTRDVTGPSWVTSSPADGAGGIALGTVFAVTFDEPPATPAAGSWRLETAAGTSIAAAASVADDVLEVTPAAALPSSTEVQLVLTATLADRAGNALVNPQTLSFTTAAGSAAGAPVVNPVPPRYLCASSWTLTGTAVASAVVRVEGGAGAVEVRAAADGSFAVPVALLPGRLHRLSVTSLTAGGAASPAAVVEIVQDCAAPAVASAERAGGVFTVHFSEPVAPSTVAGAVSLSNAGGAVAGSVAVAPGGVQATWTASAALPSGSYRLEVAQAVTDLAGNALAFPYSQIFSDAAEETFFSGTVIDDAGGRPLAGARVVVTATNGVATAEPQPEQTTGADGRFLIAVPEGTHDLTIARPGYTPVFRIVTTVDGLGTEVFDPRLTPASAPQAVNAAAGGTVTAAGATLDVPASALAANAQVALTAVGEQGLAALLPYGWSPRGAVWLDVDQALASPATLFFAVESPNGLTLTVAELDLATLQWRSLADVQVIGGEVTVPVPGLGAYAALEPDSGALAPPPAAAGEVLGSSPAPVGGEVTAASVGFDPEIVLPTQTSAATVVYTLVSEAPSGLPLTLVIREELELLDGTLRRSAPYRADLVLYRALDGTPRSRFRLQPSVAARTLPIRLGAEDVTVLPYADESVRGNVLGPEGGTVVGDAGDRLAVAAGALTAPTAVTLTRRAVADLPLAAPAGGTVDGVVEVDLGGIELAAPGTLTLKLDTPPSAGEVGLLLQVVDVGGAPRYRAVAELVPSASGWTTKAIVPADLPWPGVTTGGQYVFLHLAAPHAFVRGTARQVDGTPLAGGIIESPSVEWIQITGADGRYVLPVPVGEVTIEITHPGNGNAVTMTVTASAGDERVDLDPQLVIVAPVVVETTPANGAVVPAGIQPTVRFNEPVDPSTVAAGVTLVDAGGQAVASDYDVQGALVTVLPRSTLAPGGAYELRAGYAVRDLQGYELARPYAVSFTVQVVTLPSSINPAKISLIEPDAAGLARVVGMAGAVPADTLVWVENLSSYSTTESVTSAANGSFELTIGAAIGDRLLFHVLVEGGNEVIVLLGPFMSADRKSAWVGPDAARFATADGVTVIVDEGTFAGWTKLRVASRPVSPEPIPLPAPGILEPVFAFDLDFGALSPQKPLRLRVPAPAGATSGWYLAARTTQILGRPLWTLKDVLVLDGGELSNERGLPKSAGLKEKAAEPLDPRDYQVGIVTGGTYNVFTSTESLGWMVMPMVPGAFVFVTAIPSMIVEVFDALAYVFGLDRVAVPTLLGQDFELVAEDATTGYEIFRQVHPAQVAEVVELPISEWGDQARPYPVAGSPLRFYVLEATPGLERDVAAGIQMELTANRDAEGQLLADQTLTVTFAARSLVVPEGVSPLEVRILDLEGGEVTNHTVGPAITTSDVTITRTVQAGRPHLMTVGAVIRTDAWLEIAFNEALESALAGFELYLAEGEPPGKKIDELRREPVGGYDRVRLRPQAGWRAGKTYGLRLTNALQDVAGNGWLEGTDATHLDVTFEVRRSETFHGFDFQVVRDVARIGNLLLVAAGQQGLWVLDASDPKELKNYLPGNLHFPFPLGDQVQGVEVDPHGRAIVVGGGLTGYGQVKILDVRKLGELIPTIPAGDPAGIRFEAFRGSSLVTDKVGSDATTMPEGRPSRVMLLSSDISDVWIVGEAPPAGVTVTPPTPPAGPDPFTLVVESTNGQPGNPVTLRNRTRGRGLRVDAETEASGQAGHYRFEMEVRRGEELELLRNRDAVAYVTIEGYGLTAVDVNHFYGELEDANGDGQPDFRGSNVQSQVLRYHSDFELPPSAQLCDPGALETPFHPLELAILAGRTKEEPWTLPVLVHAYGVALLKAKRNLPVDLELSAGRCGTGTGRMTGMAVAERYRVRLVDADGEPAGEEERDYVVMTNTLGWLLVVDVTERAAPKVVARIVLPSPAAAVTVDRANRQLLVSANDEGIYVVDFNGPFSSVEIDVAQASMVDEDGDGKDDRVLEQIEVLDQQGEAINVNRPVELWSDLGLAWIGGLNDLASTGTRGLAGLALAPPRLRMVAEHAGKLREVSRIAPFGVPTAKEGATADSPSYPGLVRVEASLPSSVADASGEIRVDLVGLGPGGLEVRGAGDPAQIADLPKTSYRGSDGLVLKRQSANLWEEGSSVFVSDPVVVLADLRASHHYHMSTQEEEASETAQSEPLCVRCDLVAEEVYEADAEGNVNPDHVHDEILSGHQLGVLLPTGLRTQLEAIYDKTLVARAEITVRSVPWDLSPALRQEPALNPSLGTGDVVPGTLLHSGEMTLTATDVSIPGRGYPFVFTRTYRSQTLGSSPLGPGWDHDYHMRLREFPNGDVEYFDGRGRREIFTLNDEKDGFKPSPGRFEDLHRYADGWTLVDTRRNLLRFDRFGRLESIIDPIKNGEDNGTRLRFFYNQASNLVRVEAHGRDLYFEYDDENRLTKIVDHTSREWSYEYSAAGLLTSVKTPAVTTGIAQFPNGLTTTYAYEPMAGGDLAAKLHQRDNLESVDDPRPEAPWLNLTYGDADSDGRSEEVIQQDWGGDTVAIAYAFDTRVTTVTDRRQKTWIYHHNDSGHVTEIHDPLGAKTDREYGVYDEEHGLPRLVRLPSGRVTRYAYTEEGMAADPSSRSHLANVKEITVEPSPDASDGDGGTNGSAAQLVTRLEDYDAATNQPRTVIRPRQFGTYYQLDRAGLPTQVRREADPNDACGSTESVTELDYTGFGEVRELQESTTPSSSHLTCYEYHEEPPRAGYLKSVTEDPTGGNVITTFETDERGNVTRVQTSEGATHELVYNELDWLVEEHIAVGEIDYDVEYVYDEIGQVVEERRDYGPGGVTKTTYSYGVLGEVLSTTREIMPGLGSTTGTREYDENRNLRKALGPDGQVTEFTYDDRNQVTEVVRAGGTPLEVRESYTYNVDGQVKTITDARGFTSITRYDGYGRVKEQVDPLGNLVRIAYDDNGNPVETKVYDDLETLLAHGETIYDAMDRATGLKRWLWEYDAPAPVELLSRTCYDSASNVILEVDPLGHATSYAYDSAQRLERVTDHQGNAMVYHRHPGKNQAWKVQEEQMLPSGATVTIETTFTHDALGRQRTVTNGLGQTTTYDYDVRGNLIRITDAAGNVITRDYDGLDRLTGETRPEGIAVSYGYDASSRQTSYQDALGNTTSWAYDVLDRQTSVTYPDTKTESYKHDPNGNVFEITQPTGTIVTQGFDKANRLKTRAIIPGPGVEGPTAETYHYDGLGRLKLAVSGEVTTTRTYDSLSRLRGETNLGRGVTYTYDSGDAVSRIDYPSALPVRLERAGDPLNRVQSVQWDLPSPVTVAGYGYRGAGLVAAANLGPLTRTVEFEPGTNRPAGARFEKAGGARVFAEAVRWKPNDLKNGVARGDLNDRTVGFTYDNANRLKVAEHVVDIDSSVPVTRALATIPDRFGFTYDAAQNLTSKTAARVCEADTVALPPDGSGRNRPGSVDGVGLAWDANGNLSTKGDLTYYYDFQNRLTRVAGPAGNVAAYTYDAFNRRVRREVAGQTLETVWDDWQPIEEWQSSDQVTYALRSRRTYGLGLDEIVALEIDFDGDGTLTQYTPIYDHAGNLAMVTDAAGEVVERYEYSPYGDQWILVDSTPPAVEQVRSVGDELWVEFSEEVQRDLIDGGVSSGQLYLKNLESGAIVNVELTWPVKSGRQANRRLVVRGTDPPETTEWPAADESFELYIHASIVSDTFNNVATQTYQQSFIWSSPDVVFEDLANPRLDRICVASGAILELEFSEALSLASATDRILVNGQPLTWTMGGDGYTVRSSAPLAEGAYTLTIDAGELDLDGRGLAGAPFTSAGFSVVSGAPEEVFNAPYQGLVASSTIGNPFGFHGIGRDSETELLYFRNRYFDPELGRFITTDPMRYGDGPSMYQFAGNNPLNFTDPMGLECMDLFGEEYTRCTDYFPFLEKGRYRQQRIKLVRRSKDRSLTQEERNRAASAANTQIPLWLAEEVGALFYNSILHQWAVDWDESLAVEGRFDELLRAPGGVRMADVFTQLEAEGYDTGYLVKGGMPSSSIRRSLLRGGLRRAAPRGLARLLGRAGRSIFGETRFRGLVQGRRLADLTHQEIEAAFRNSPFRIDAHAISRLKDSRTGGLGAETLDDIARLLNKGTVANAGGGDIAIQLGRLEAIVDPPTRTIMTFRPYRFRH